MSQAPEKNWKPFISTPESLFTYYKNLWLSRVDMENQKSEHSTRAAGQIQFLLGGLESIWKILHLGVCDAPSQTVLFQGETFICKFVVFVAKHFQKPKNQINN
jgi:hypothetical protein